MKVLLLIASFIRGFILKPDGRMSLYNTRPPTLHADNTRIVEINDPDVFVKELTKWKDIVDGYPSIYPNSTRDSVKKAIQYVKTPELIRKNFTQVVIITGWVHEHPARNNDLFKDVIYDNDNKPIRKFTSHYMITLLDQFNKKFTVYGIIENPENIFYEYSIVSMVYKFKAMLKKSAGYRCNIEPLKDWCYGVHYFSLKNTEINAKEKNISDYFKDE